MKNENTAEFKLYDEYPDRLYMCPDCGRTQKVVGIGTNFPDLSCRCKMPEYMNMMIEMIPKPPIKKPKDTRKQFRLKRKYFNLIKGKSFWNGRYLYR